MSYARYRQDYIHRLSGTRNIGNVEINIPIPAGQTVIIYDLKAYMSTAGSGATCALEIVQDGGAALATVTTGNTTGTKTSGSTFPIAVTGASGGSVLQVRQVTANDTSGVGHVFLDIEKPFAR
jgi:hypothetical protein